MTEEVKKCIEQAERFLSIREHNHNELRLKLRVKGYSDSDISDSFEFLDACNELSEERYIRSFIRSNNSRHPEGQSVLHKRLMQKGADKLLSKQILSEIYDSEYSEKMLDNAVKSVLSKDRGRSDYRKILKKLVDLGFSLQLASKKLSEKNNIKVV